MQPRSWIEWIVVIQLVVHPVSPVDGLLNLREPCALLGAGLHLPSKLPRTDLCVSVSTQNPARRSAKTTACRRLSSWSRWPRSSRVIATSQGSQGASVLWKTKNRAHPRLLSHRLIDELWVFQKLGGREPALGNFAQCQHAFAICM